MTKPCSHLTLALAMVAALASCSKPGTRAPSSGDERAAAEQPGDARPDTEPGPTASPVGGDQPATGQGAAAVPATGEPRTAAETAAGINALGIELYERVVEGNDNVFLSPYSIAVALAMTYEGARGSTATQMAEALHFEVPAEELRPGMQALAGAIEPEAGAGYELHVANALWGMQGYRFQPAFLEVLRTSYQAPLQQVDFAAGDEARQTINAWVARATRDKIEDLIPQGLLTPLTRLVLTNAIYFKGDWAEQFEPGATREAPFTVLDGTQARTKLMHQVSEFGYRETADAQVLSLPYEGGALSMVVVLPRKPDGLPALESKLSAATLAGWTQGLRSRKVSVFLPRMKIESAFSLSDTLSAMGMGDAFAGGRADFSGMDGTRELYIQGVVHKAFVEIDEEGTEAAAATGVAMGVRSVAAPPPEFRADHPFLFFIRHEATGSVLFLGRMARPGA